MADVLNGLGEAILAEFGGPVTVVPPTGDPDDEFEVTGVLRQSATEQSVADGRRIWWRWGTLRVSRDAPEIAVGSLVSGASAPGQTFEVQARIEPESPAPDALVIYDLDRVN